MKKLELKHLAGYLPYGLKVTKEDWKKVFKIDNDGTTLNCVGIDYVLNVKAKPILHPLSDLTKEIEVNGEKFVPIYGLCKLSFGHLDLNKQQIKIDYTNEIFSICISGVLSFSFDCNDNSFIAINKGKTVCVPNQLELFKKIYEWHFDIYGLIDKGLAIDINILKTQP